MMRRLLFILTCLFWLGISLVSAQDTGNIYVLVHGAFQDETGWDGVIETLEANGDTAIAVQLPGRGDDDTPMGEITLENHRDAVIAVIEEQDQAVILVGHSFGGLVISAVAEAIPDQIEQLVYVSAYLPVSGDSLVSLASNDHYSTLGQEGNFVIADDFSYGAVNADIFASAFCPDCDEEQLAVVAASQLNEPLMPLNQPVEVTEGNFGSVYKVYIMTAEDVVVSPQLQAYMLSRTPADDVYALNTGHAPYISQPEALAQLLIDTAAE